MLTENFNAKEELDVMTADFSSDLTQMDMFKSK